MIEIKKGLNLPIEGTPDTTVDASRFVRRVALVGADYVGMKPSMAVGEGDRVKLGQLLFEDKKTPGVCFTSPGCGVVEAIQRGAKRRFQSVVIRLEGEDEVVFPSRADRDIDQLTRDQVRDPLVASGLWTALRTRPYSKVPGPDSSPRSIFVSAMNTNPLAVSPESVIAEQAGDFSRGLQVLGRLTDGSVFVCAAPEFEPPGSDLPYVKVERFSGPHPAGLPGTHIHFLDPVSPTKTVWHINYQDVLAFGKFLASGRIPTERVIALAGPAVRRPRLLKTRIGASISDLVDGELGDGETRILSGSVLSGRIVDGPQAYLGRYHLQIAALAEGRQRVMLDWLRPGFNRFSIKKVYASALAGDSPRVPFTTSREGARRSMVPIGMYEQVMPLDILPTQLLRALIVGDTDQAQALGCLELDEEDLALCAFVCPGKYEFGPLLRECLGQIEKEG